MHKFLKCKQVHEIPNYQQVEETLNPIIPISKWKIVPPKKVLLSQLSNAKPRSAEARSFAKTFRFHFSMAPMGSLSTMTFPMHACDVSASCPYGDLLKLILSVVVQAESEIRFQSLNPQEIHLMFRCYSHVIRRKFEPARTWGLAFVPFLELVSHSNKPNSVYYVYNPNMWQKPPQLFRVDTTSMASPPHFSSAKPIQDFWILENKEPLQPDEQVTVSFRNFERCSPLWYLFAYLQAIP